MSLAGDGKENCVVCQSPINEYRELKITVRLKDKPDDPLTSLGYFLPLCEKHNGKGAKDEIVEVSLKWGDVLVPKKDVLG